MEIEVFSDSYIKRVFLKLLFCNNMIIKGKEIRKCVCISCFDYYDTRMHSILDYFQNKGVETTYVLSDFSHFEKKKFKVDYPRSIQVHVNSYKKNVSVRRIISHLTFSHKLSRIIKEQAPDLIYCMFPPNSLVKTVIKYKRDTGCVVIFDGYDLWPAGLVNWNSLKLVKFLLNAWGNLRDNYIGESDMIITVSEGMQDYFHRKYDVPVKLLYPRLIPQYPNYSYDIDDEISFCYLGNINHIPDIDLITEITKELRKTKKVSLHIIGEGEKLGELLRKVESNGIKCYTHGVVMDMKEKIRIYESCHLALNVPCVIAQSTMSLKSVEYMSVGLPSLNTGGGDNWQIVEKYSCGFNIDRNDVKSTINALRSLTSQELKSLSNNSRKAYKDLFNAQRLDEIFVEELNEQ